MLDVINKVDVQYVLHLTKSRSQLESASLGKSVQEFAGEAHGRDMI